MFAFGPPVVHPQLKPALTYLIGEPGSGKSTLAAHLTRGLRYVERDGPFAHRLYTCGVYELGKRRPDFPGTDALSMSVQPRVLQWLAEVAPFRVLGEGDRLGTESFFKAVEELGYAVNVWMLDGPDVAALHRRIRGSEQDEQWIAGRRSKVSNIASARSCQLLRAGARPEVLETVMLEAGDPVVRALRGVK